MIERGSDAPSRRLVAILVEITRGCQALQFADPVNTGSWADTLPAVAARVWPVDLAQVAAGACVSAIAFSPVVGDWVSVPHTACVPLTSVPYIAHNDTRERFSTGMCAPCTSGSPDFLSTVVRDMHRYSVGMCGVKPLSTEAGAGPGADVDADTDTDLDQ